MTKDGQLRERLLEIHDLAVSTSFISTKDALKLRSLLAQLIFDFGFYLGANPPIILHLSGPPRDAAGRFIALRSASPDA